MGDDKITVMITGLGGGGFGMQILKALRLSSLNYHIIGADITSESFGLSMANSKHVVPPATDPDYLDNILNLINNNNVQALFYGSEPELKIFSQQREKFTDNLLLPLNPQTLIDNCLDKSKTMHLLNQNGFHTPSTYLINDISEISAIDFLPCICKPSTGGGGSKNVFIAQTRRELELATEYLLNYTDSVLVQEYVGTIDDEFTVGVLADIEGKIIDSIAVKRNIMSALSNRVSTVNRSGNTNLGDTLAISSGISQGKVGHYHDISSVCIEAAKKLGAHGPINFQCRYVEDKVIFFEINPRFSGTTSIRAIMGFNEPDILVRKHILGEKITNISYREGTVLRGLCERII